MGYISQTHDEQFDPEPLTIALSLLSSIVPIGVLITERVIDPKQSEKKQTSTIHNELYNAYRALCDLHQILSNFVSFLDSQGNLQKTFRIGKAPINGDYRVIFEFMDYHRDSYFVGKCLNQAMINLNRELDQEDYELCMSYRDDLLEALEFAMQPEDYQNFTVMLDRSIQLSRNLILDLGNNYGFQLGNYQTS